MRFSRIPRSLSVVELCFGGRNIVFHTTPPQRRGQRSSVENPAGFHQIITGDRLKITDFLLPDGDMEEAESTGF